MSASPIVKSGVPILIILVIIVGLGFLCDHLPTAIDDNPAVLRSVDSVAGELEVTFRVDGGSVTEKARLARVPRLVGHKVECALRLLNEDFEGRFAAFLNDDGEFEFFVWDEQSSQEISFNDVLKQFLEVKCPDPLD